MTDGLVAVGKDGEQVEVPPEQLERSTRRKIDVYWLRDGRLGAVFSGGRRPADCTSIFDTVEEHCFPLDVVRVIDRDDIASGELRA